MALEIKISDIRDNPNMKLLELAGELDSLGSRSLSEQLLPVIQKGGIYLFMDLTKLTYINSTGIYIVLRAYTKAKERNGFLKMVSVNKRVEEILEMTGLTKMIPSYSTLDEALKDF